MNENVCSYRSKICSLGLNKNRLCYKTCLSFYYILTHDFAVRCHLEAQVFSMVVFQNNNIINIPWPRRSQKECSSDACLTFKWRRLARTLRYKRRWKKVFFFQPRNSWPFFPPLTPFLSFSSIISDFSEKTPKENRLHAIQERDQRERDYLVCLFPLIPSPPRVC